MSFISFDINDQNHTLYFGMDAYQIVAENSTQAVQNGGLSAVEGFAFIIWGGMVNNSVLERLNKPTFKEAYLLMTDIIEQGEELQNKISTAWTDSIANKKLTQTLDGLKKKEEPKKVKIGMK